ncbi:MAG TPA: hypothetical protein VF598_01645 [Hymenobacter sp.]|jgi:hypothetical protein
MAKKTLEQLNAERDKLRMQLQALEDQRAEIAEAEANEQRKFVDDALAKYNEFAKDAGKPALFLAPHKSGGAGTRGPRKSSGNKPGDYTTDQKNKAVAHLQQAKGKAIGGTELSKLVGYPSMMTLFATEIGEGTIKADGQGRSKTYKYVG